ncbi:CHASE3 domain-containing protein [Actinoallomurus acaciae]|uniref:histidine kinase n=1 Tax=Actinoallomurus acaciae TaxID=502577 RepID=A0ABV5YAE5_9ACTN
MALASALLALLIGGVFGFLAGAITVMRDTAMIARNSERVLAAAHDLERLVIDLETGQRGFLITRDEAYLEPWTAARAGFDTHAAQLDSLAAERHPEQAERAAKIVRDSRSYLREYSEPAVQATRQGAITEMSGTASTGEGKRRVDGIREQFDHFIRFEHGLAAERDARSDQAASRAVLVALGGIATSIVLITGFSGYLTRCVVRPVRRTSLMAVKVADGDFSVRMPETGNAEIGDLQHSFNTMAVSLERNRGELMASRARIVTSGDAVRRRIERDLHDGTQQRLVSLGLKLRMAESDVPPDQGHLREQLSRLATEVTEVVEELREISRGIHPPILSKRGLRPALATLARRSPIPVELQLRIDGKLPEPTEVAAYYVVSEALTNAAKHAQASCVWVEVAEVDGEIRLTVRDDGVGGADPARGSGLIGLRDRVEALGGTIRFTSPASGGTTLSARIPAG